jgi:uncharacterized Zn finger protein
MTASVTVPCPACGDEGPHKVLRDHPDPGLTYHVGLSCRACRSEFRYLEPDQS